MYEDNIWTRWSWLIIIIVTMFRGFPFRVTKTWKRKPTRFNIIAPFINMQTWKCKNQVTITLQFSLLSMPSCPCETDLHGILIIVFSTNCRVSKALHTWWIQVWWFLRTRELRITAGKQKHLTDVTFRVSLRELLVPEQSILTRWLMVVKTVNCWLCRMSRKIRGADNWSAKGMYRVRHIMLM